VKKKRVNWESEFPPDERRQHGVALIKRAYAVYRKTKNKNQTNTN
jgi:hypothetical protein